MIKAFLILLLGTSAYFLYIALRSPRQFGEAILYAFLSFLFASGAMALYVIATR